GVQPTVRAPVVLPEVLTEAARAAPVDRGRVGVDAELQARPVQVGAPAIEVGGDLVIELRPVGVVVDGHVHGHAGRPPRLAVDPDADRGVVVAAAGPFLPVGFLRTAVLVAGDHREAVGTEIVDLAAPQGLARHPLRARTTVGAVSDGAEVTGWADSRARRRPGRVVEERADRHAEPGAREISERCGDAGLGADGGGGSRGDRSGPGCTEPGATEEGSTVECHELSGSSIGAEVAREIAPA